MIWNNPDAALYNDGLTPFGRVVFFGLLAVAAGLTIYLGMPGRVTERIEVSVKLSYAGTHYRGTTIQEIGANQINWWTAPRMRYRWIEQDVDISGNAVRIPVPGYGQVLVTMANAKGEDTYLESLIAACRSDIPVEKPADFIRKLEAYGTCRFTEENMPLTVRVTEEGGMHTVFGGRDGFVDPQVRLVEATVRTTDADITEDPGLIALPLPASMYSDSVRVSPRYLCRQE